MVIEVSSDFSAFVVNIEDGQTVRLYVNKPAGATFVMTGINGTVDGSLSNNTDLVYEITKVNGFTIARQMNKIQFNGSINKVDIGVGDCLLETVHYCNYQVNNNILTLEGSFSLAPVKSPYYLDFFNFSLSSKEWNNCFKF